MPLGLVDDSVFDESVRDDSVFNRGTVVDIKSGRGTGNTEVPDSLRKIIGENAVEDGSKETKELTEFLGVSNSSLSAYKKGSTGTSNYNKPEPELESHINGVKRRITKKATNRLFRALDKIDDEKLEKEDARALAGIAKDMSAIVKNMEPESERSNSTHNNTLVIHAPITISEDRFETIRVIE